MTNAAHIALSVRSLLWLSDSSCFWWISVLTVLAHFPSSSFSLCFRTFLHPIFLLPLTPLSHHSGLTSQSSHLLCQRLCTHTFFLSSPTSSITLSLPVFLSSFFLHTQSSTCRSSLQQLHFFLLFFRATSPRSTGRWISSSQTAAWTSTTACFRSCCSSNTWCGASVMSGFTSREQVRGQSCWFRTQLELQVTSEKQEFRISPVVLQWFIKYTWKRMLRFFYLFIQSKPQTCGIVVKPCASLG